MGIMIPFALLLVRLQPFVKRYNVNVCAQIQSSLWKLPPWNKKQNRKLGFFPLQLYLYLRSISSINNCDKVRIWVVWRLFSSPQIIFGECFLIYLRSRASFSCEYVVCVYKAVGSFVFGAALSQSLTDIAKYTIGRLRPHFLTVCKPHWSLIDCKSGYIENFTCTGDPGLTNEGRWVKHISLVAWEIHSSSSQTNISDSLSC